MSDAVTVPTVPAEHFLKVLESNLECLSDTDFKEFVRTSLPIVVYKDEEKITVKLLQTLRHIELKNTDNRPVCLNSIRRCYARNLGECITRGLIEHSTGGIMSHTFHQYALTTLGKRILLMNSAYSVINQKHLDIS